VIGFGSLTGFSLFHCRRPFISERLQEKKKEKFGNVQDDFTGPSDAFDAPLDLQGNTGGKDLYFISPMDNTATSGEEGSMSVESPQATSVKKEAKTDIQQDDVRMEEESDNQAIKDSSEEGQVKT